MPSGANTRSKSKGPFFNWTKSLPRSTSPACCAVRSKPSSRNASTRALPLAGERSTKRSASWVVSGKPNRIAPDLPMNRYRTPCLRKISRISSAWRYSKAAIAEPIGQVFFAPAAILFHRIKSPKRHVIQYRFMGVDESIAESSSERTTAGGLEFIKPLARYAGGLLDDVFHFVNLTL